MSSSKWNESDYLASWPKFQPFPYSIKRGARPVPNSNAVNWPQSQFAPMYLAPGEPSFQPYSYLKNDVPLESQQPRYTTTNYGPYRRSGVGPGGDTVALPSEYGAIMQTRMNPDTAAKMRTVARTIQVLRSRRQTAQTRRQLQQASLLYRALHRSLQAQQNPLLIMVADVHGHEELTPVTRKGWMPTSESIPEGVPSTESSPIPDSMLIPPSSRESATGLDTSMGDGFAYELAPLQASAPYSYGGIGQESARKNPCNCSKLNPSRAKKNPSTGILLGIGLALGVGYYMFSQEPSAV